MRRVSAVIGGQFGDEGKGLITDYLSAGPDTLVVRFNGGAQAGHTVVTPDGRRHVFHQFGSGSFNGSPTFLSRFFLVNPMFFGQELAELEALGVTPTVFVDPDSMVTTPYDVMLNQAAEAQRGNARHGSCGLGINETVERSQHSMYRLRVGDLANVRLAPLKLINIRDFYVPQRARELGLPLDSLPHLEDEGVLDRFLEDCRELVSRCFIGRWESLRWDGDIVFEGAQGLKLDQGHANFPHVTRSNTGVQNVLDLMRDARIQEPLEAYFLTRTYVTRHGAGPLAWETKQPPYSAIVDLTNVPNPHQGALRFGLFDVDDFLFEVARDLGKAGNAVVKPCLVMTCCDQVDEGRIQCLLGRSMEMGVRVEDLFWTLKIKGRFERGLMSYGPTRDDIEEVRSKSTIGSVSNSKEAA